MEAGALVDRPGLVEEQQQPVQNFIQHLRTGKAVQHHGELIASDTECLAGALHGLLQLPREQLQEFISGKMAKGVIELLEPVAIEQGERNFLFAVLRLADQILHIHLEMGPVGNGGQVIIEGQLMQALFILLALGDLPGYQHELRRNSTASFNRGNLCFQPYPVAIC
ncbi:hypothetical protein D3C75_958740 [compost metagenome]